MKFFGSLNSSRVLFPAGAGLAGIALGWCLCCSSFPTVASPPPGPSVKVEVSNQIEARISSDRWANRSEPLTEAIHDIVTFRLSKTADEVIERMVVADGKNMINLLEAVGDMTRLSDEQVKKAWVGLNSRPPIPSMGGSAAALYLWSRMGYAVDLPKGWGAENYGSTIALEKSGERSTDLRRKLEAGQMLDDTQRTMVFTEVLRTDPHEAVMLWMKHTKPWDFQVEGRLFGNALSDPKTRDAILTQAREWQTDKDLMGTLVATLGKDWIAREPREVERWVNLPAQADIRTRVMEQIVNVRALSNPTDAWQWSQSLPEKERQQALALSAAQLANQQQATGAQLIASLRNPADREVAIREYGRVLVANSLEQWKQWRDGLPAQEQAVTNASAFQLWVFHEPDNAVNWLKTQADGPAKDTMIDTLVDVYAERDPRTAAEWIQTIPDPERRRQAAISALAAVGPEKIDSIRMILASLQN